MRPEPSPLTLAALRRLDPAAPEPPIHMLIITRRRGDRHAWAACSDDGWSASALCPPGAATRGAWLFAAERVLERLTEVQAPVVLQIEKRPRRYIGRILDGVAGVLAVTDVYRGELYDRALDDIECLLAPFSPAPPSNPPRPFTIATDGSYRRGVGSWAWLAEDEQFAARAVRCAHALDVELIAIHQALMAYGNKPRELAIVSDSVAALSYLDPDSYGPSDAWDTRPTTRRAHQAVLSVRRIVEQRMLRVRFVWVRGHSGHPLNEGADRLAAVARRTIGMPRNGERAATLERIAAEATEGWAPIRKIWWASPEATGRPPEGAGSRPPDASERASAS